MATLLFTLIGCSEEIYENQIQKENSANQNAISFSQFKKETGITQFKPLKSIRFNNDFNNQDQSKFVETGFEEADFVTDTTQILKYVDTNNSATYSFRIYPLSETLKPTQYYNLVYDKYENEWNEMVFLNTETENPQGGTPMLESSQMVYNQQSAIINVSGFCQSIHREAVCDRICPPGNCDAFVGCKTCKVKEIVSYIYCEKPGGTDYVDIVAPPNGSDGAGGGEEFSGIYIPNPYDVANMNNADFIFQAQVASFTSSLDHNLQDFMKQNFWIYNNIVTFMKSNGGLTFVNKQAVKFALTNSNLIFENLNVPSWNTTEKNQFKVNSFMFLLQNPNSTGSSLIKHLIDNKWSEESVLFANFKINFLKENPDTTIKQFDNWFNTLIEGSNSNISENVLQFDSAYWNNSNIIFQPRSRKLISFC